MLKKLGNLKAINVYYCNDCSYTFKSKYMPCKCPKCKSDEIHIDGTDN